MADDDLKNLLLANAAEIRRHFDVAVERIDERSQLLAEAITHVDQKLDRTTAVIVERIEQTAAETQR